MSDSGKTISFGALETFSNQFAHLMRDHGLKRGDVVAICLENHPYFLPICWGTFRAGLYFTAISYRLSADEVSYIVNDCGAKILITSKQLTHTFEQLYPELEDSVTPYFVDGTHPNAD